jgi:hypothetical protein
MRLNRFLTSGTISSKHYLRAFYTLLPLSCFFKDNPLGFGRNTGEYRGQFDKLNIAMVLVGNRLYYVTFEKIEKL